MLTKEQKSKIVDELVDKLKRQKIAIFTDFHGIAVSKAQILRRALRKVSAEYKVAKKTLLDRALRIANMTVSTKELHGEIGVAFGYEDEMQPAQQLVKFGKQNETFKILAGVLNGRVLTGKEVLTLAKLPGREILLGQLVKTLAAPLRGLTTVLQGNIRNLVVIINKIKGQRV